MMQKNLNICEESAGIQAGNILCTQEHRWGNKLPLLGGHGLNITQFTHNSHDIPIHKKSEENTQNLDFLYVRQISKSNPKRFAFLE